jgi:hypothetical protein
MSQRSQEQQRQEANPHLTSSQDVESRTPVNLQGAAAGALQRARVASTPPLSPSDILALQQTVGNRAVQRLVETPGGTVQRHVDAGLTSWATRLRGQLNTMGTSIVEHRATEDDEWNAATAIFHEQFPHGGSGSQASSEGAAGDEAQAPE